MTKVLLMLKYNSMIETSVNIFVNYTTFGPLFVPIKVSDYLLFKSALLSEKAYMRRVHVSLAGLQTPL